MDMNIQQAILATFLWSNDVGTDTEDAFTLNINLFDGDRRLIAAKINEVTESEDRFYGMLNLELENTSSQEWLYISTQTPLPFSVAKRLHDKQDDPRGDRI